MAARPLVAAAFAALVVGAALSPSADAAPPRLRVASVKKIALEAARPYLDEASPSRGLPFAVVSVRLAVGSRGDRVWVVRVRAHYFRWPCPRQPSTADPCVDSPSEYAAVHIRDKSATVYSVKPIPNP